MWTKLAASGCLTLGLVVVGCASDPDPDPAPDPPPRDLAVEGFFQRKQEARGTIDWVAFEPARKYTLHRTGEPSFEEGTYTFDEARTSVTFRTSSGQSTTSAIAGIDDGANVGAIAGSGLTRTATAQLVEPGHPLVTPVRGLVIDGSELERVAGAFFCKDAKLVNPMNGNCGGQGLCKAGQIHCVKLTPA